MTSLGRFALYLASRSAAANPFVIRDSQETLAQVRCQLLARSAEGQNRSKA